MAAKYAENKVESAERFAYQAEKLSLLPGNQRENENFEGTTAVQARFITPQDPVIETADGGRLPAIPLAEAHKLNALKDEAEGKDSTEDRVATIRLGQKDPVVDTENGKLRTKAKEKIRKEEGGTSLQTQIPPSHTNPLFPQLPLYGPPTLLRNIHCGIFRCSSFFLSLAFLGVIVLGSAFTSIPLMFRHIGLRLMFRDPDARRPFYKQEKERQRARKEENKAWKQKRRRRESIVKAGGNTQEEDAGYVEEYIPTEGGKDPLICDVGYYARRVGLDVEEFKVQTEDGFIIALWHVYNPKEYTPVSDEKRRQRSPDLFSDDQSTNGSRYGASGSQFEHGRRKYPVLMVHGLLQSAGAYCTNDDDSLAFFLCKRSVYLRASFLVWVTANMLLSGYDVWLGNNRCGFKPEHQMLTYSDPRMWAWNIRQMGVIDLPALVSRVLSETGFEKLGLICHSQGTTETFVALAKEQRPDLGAKISVFCALAPAVYAGPLIGKMYFKFMRAISPGMFRIFFGIHAFIPFMMTMHALLPGKLYGALGYRVFSFLFNWSDERWDQGLRDRMFQFAPVYVSAESMRYVFSLRISWKGIGTADECM